MKQPISKVRKIIGVITLCCLLIFVWYLQWGYAYFEEEIGKPSFVYVPESFQNTGGKSKPQAPDQ